MMGIERQLGEVKQRGKAGILNSEDFAWLVNVVERQGQQIAEYEGLRAAICMAFAIHPAARPSRVLAHLEELFGSPPEIPLEETYRLGMEVLEREVTFSKFEGDPAHLQTCGECRAIVADLDAHRDYHRALSRVFLQSYRNQAHG
jgi:hypothetical protein